MLILPLFSANGNSASFYVIAYIQRYILAIGFLTKWSTEYYLESWHNLFEVNHMGLLQLSFQVLDLRSLHTEFFWHSSSYPIKMLVTDVKTQKIDPNFFYDGRKFRRQCVNVIDTTWDRVYFITCAIFRRKFQTQCAMTLVLSSSSVSEGFAPHMCWLWL